MAKGRTVKTLSFFIRLIIVLSIIFGIGFSGYLVIDRAVIPNYFGKYGIHNFKDLIEMVQTMYNTPEEKDFITHPFKAADETSALNKLENANIPIVDGKIDFNQIIDGKVEINPEVKENGEYFSDTEMAAVLDQMLQSGILSSYLNDLSYIDTLSIHARELIITVIEDDTMTELDGSRHSNSAKVSLTVKVDTTKAQKHMAKQMDVPIFLLNLIMPDVLYMTTAYNVTIDSEGKYVTTNTLITVNGRNKKQSEILLNLLIAFIFPEEDEMTVEKLGETFADITNSGLSILGDVRFTNSGSGLTQSNGITIALDPQIEGGAEEPIEP